MYFPGELLRETRKAKQTRTSLRIKLRNKSTSTLREKSFHDDKAKERPKKRSKVAKKSRGERMATTSTMICYPGETMIPDPSPRTFSVMFVAWRRIAVKTEEYTLYFDVINDSVEATLALFSVMLEPLAVPELYDAFHEQSIHEGTVIEGRFCDLCCKMAWSSRLCEVHSQLNIFSSGDEVNHEERDTVIFSNGVFAKLKSGRKMPCYKMKHRSVVHSGKMWSCKHGQTNHQPDCRCIFKDVTGVDTRVRLGSSVTLDDIKSARLNTT